MGIEKLGIDYHLKGYNTWIIGIPTYEEGYTGDLRAWIESDNTLWTKRFVLRLL